jgi:clan AA aspartic protease (TIGR02281 family)
MYTVNHRISALSRCISAGIVLAITALTVYGDKIHLKSGGEIDGLIIAEQRGVVTIDVGFGTTRVDSSDIDSIVRSSGDERVVLKKEWLGRYYDDDKLHSAALKPFIESMRCLRALRAGAVLRKRALDGLKSEIDSLNMALAVHAGEYISLNGDLATLSRKSPLDQYRIVGKAHEYNSSIIECRKQIEEKQAECLKGNPQLALYMDSLDRVGRVFGVFKKSCPAKTIAENREPLHLIENDLRQFGAEFEAATIDVTFIQGNNIVVPVFINGKPPVLLLLDTGASTVVLSRSLAEKLGIHWRSGGLVKVSLADGEIISGYSIVLRSVAVKDFRAFDVRAIVLENAPAPGINGLLGMSYLDRFSIHIDGLNRKLVLKKFRAW